jgi:hypothetical protein
MLSPVPGSFVAKLCSASHPCLAPTNTAPTTSDEVQTYLLNCSLNTSNKNNTGADHTDIVFNATNELSKLVNGHVSHVKNTVLPIVEEFRLNYMDYLEKTSLKDPGEDFEVRGYVTPALILNSRFEELYIHRKDEKIFSTQGVKLIISDKPIAEVKDIAHMLVFSNNKVNEDIKEWLEIVSEEWLIKTYNDIFVNGYIDAEFANPYHGLNCGVLLSLVGIYLEKENPNNAKYINIKELGFDLIYRHKKTIEFSKAGTRLVIGVDQFSKVISVDNDLYT